MSNAMELTSANFQATVANGVTLVDFWAEWCGPCRMMGPVLDEIAKQYAGRATVGKVNVDNEGDLAAQFGVSSIPMLAIFKNGQVVKQFVGVTPKAELAAALDAVLT
ncbi:MAG TPA: thioredoxin [Candidatus Hydrogenedentes bacterium]|nr:thioredoxin [Candidatus Hydrogenedentota bacterium]HPC16645.1 thioredoxin [Candidatus Hydrogenedentota bacterium]HRT22244.1 thioredoxin [Candidatus Hydrogenedentota bacterium]HRT63496.1 thioredoxin [Candidatus Hydrogenedentota bacterium]